MATAANVHDATIRPDLLHGDETRAGGGSAHPGQTEVLRQHAPKARGPTDRRYRYEGIVSEAGRARNRTKSRIRGRVEHAFGVIEGVFHCAQGPRRGLGKTAHRPFVTRAPARFHLVRRRLPRPSRA